MREVGEEEGSRGPRRGGAGEGLTEAAVFRGMMRSQRGNPEVRSWRLIQGTELWTERCESRCEFGGWDHLCMSPHVQSCTDI